jgi:hypothetical protein
MYTQRARTRHTDTRLPHPSDEQTRDGTPSTTKGKTLIREVAGTIRCKQTATHLESRRGAKVGDYEQLHADYQAGDVCLFVGAGVSIGCGLPGWKELASGVVELFPRKPGPPLGAAFAADAAGRPPPVDPNALFGYKREVLKGLDPLLSMRYARADRELDLNSLVCQRLYRGPIKLSKTVLEIPMLEKVRRICCYNYDDMLDRAFARRKKAYKPVFEKDRIQLETEQTLVFYPHGFLPDPSRRSHGATGRIVLSEDDYFGLYGDPYAWANIVQLTLLLNYTVLFLGCSLLDPNLRRVLGIVTGMRAGHRHYAFFRDSRSKKNAPWYILNQASAFRSVQRRLLAGLGVEPIWIENHSEIPNELRRLRGARSRSKPSAKGGAGRLEGRASSSRP